MKKVPEDKTKVGRPRLNIDGEKISKWISYGATVKEIADVENCSEDHIHKVFRENITKGKAERNMRLRKAQIELALSGNCSMLIWLGKQYLGQKDSGIAPMRMPISGIQMVDDIDGSTTGEYISL